MSNGIAILILESGNQTKINIGSGSRLERTETNILLIGSRFYPFRGGTSVPVYKI